MDIQFPALDGASRAQPATRAKTIALLLPTLNELDGLKSVVPFIDRSLIDDIIVVDGGSRDGTVEYALEMGLTVVSQRRRGLHFAIYDLARAVDYDCLIEFSPDGNCKADDLPQLVAKLHDGYELVVVSRYLEHATSEGMSPSLLK